MEFLVDEQLAGQTLAAVLRAKDPQLSWSKAKRLIASRRVEINGTLALNDARRLDAGDLISLLDAARPKLPSAAEINILHIDADLCVVNKPAGIVTVRSREEEDFSEERKELEPTLQELVEKKLPKTFVVFPVHRLDRNTSGLMMFALNAVAKEALIQKFMKHEILRTYWGVCLGVIREPMRIESWIIRDRGDGIRGSAPAGTPDAKQAITHVRPIENIFDQYTVIECNLETGRTHQIRIHLAENGHMLCGERLYIRRSADSEVVPDSSGAPRQVLHSKELRFVHPSSGREMNFTSEIPMDLRKWYEKLEK